MSVGSKHWATSTSIQVRRVRARVPSVAEVNCGCATQYRREFATTAWWLGNAPTQQVLLTSYHGNYAASWGRKARDVFKEHAPRIWGKSRELAATLDSWDDPLDVYSVKLAAGETLAARVQGPTGTNMSLELWRPGTITVEGSGRTLTDRVARAAGPGPVERIVFRVRRGGWYYVAVRIAQGGFGPYALSLSKT